MELLFSNVWEGYMKPLPLSKEIQSKNKMKMNEIKGSVKPYFQRESESCKTPSSSTPSSSTPTGWYSNTSSARILTK